MANNDANAMASIGVTEEKKRYIVDVLNPVLEQLVAACIQKEAPDPALFMLDWLEKKKADDEDRQYSPDDLLRLKTENDQNEKKLAKIKDEIQETVKMTVSSGVRQEKEEEEEEEDDADDEPPPGWEQKPSAEKSRASVSAEAFGEWNQKKALVAPVFLKTDEQKSRLKSMMSNSLLFNTLEDQDLAVVISAMKEVRVEIGTIVINQGEQGDFLFVIESGKLDCKIKDGNGGPDKVVKTCAAGDVFGELALLYNCPRAATVEAVDNSVLWQLDRDTFTNIVEASAVNRRRRYDDFLAKVPLLSYMGMYERSQLADALTTESYGDSEAICKQGELGNKFYIIEEGKAVAAKDGNQVMQYGPGDYFGELALLRSQPRAATVKANGKVKLLSLDSKSFKRLLNIDALLENVSKYT